MVGNPYLRITSGLPVIRAESLTGPKGHSVSANSELGFTLFGMNSPVCSFHAVSVLDNSKLTGA